MQPSQELEPAALLLSSGLETPAKTAKPPRLGKRNGRHHATTVAQCFIESSGRRRCRLRKESTIKHAAYINPICR